ncbi:MAG: hypothetical protein M1541_21515 [Acidobacteria bacterium]|nr:hypothetical protein [Acidobacteriota bacterium]
MQQMEQPVEDGELVLARFNRLIQEILRGTMNRNCFRPWEIRLLLDIETCNLREGARRETLRRYQKAVRRAMEKGAAEPMLLSEYLESGKARRVAADAGSDRYEPPSTTA